MILSLLLFWAVLELNLFNNFWISAGLQHGPLLIGGNFILFYLILFYFISGKTMKFQQTTL